MEEKICTKCEKRKTIDNFKKFKSTNGKYYYTGVCKQCRNSECLETNRIYRNTHKKEIAILKKINYQNNKEEIRKKQKQYYVEHKEQICKKTKQWYIENKVIALQRNKRYQENNKEVLMQKKYQRKKERLQNDSFFKTKEQARNMIRTAFRRKGFIKSKKTEEILGCDLKFFFEYLLKTFYKNYGYNYDFKEEVHIDHIKPLDNAKNEDEIMQLCHYTNLQLLKAKDNLKKGTKLNWQIKIR